MLGADDPEQTDTGEVGGPGEAGAWLATTRHEAWQVYCRLKANEIAAALMVLDKRVGRAEAEAAPQSALPLLMLQSYATAEAQVLAGSEQQRRALVQHQRAMAQQHAVAQCHAAAVAATMAAQKEQEQEQELAMQHRALVARQQAAAAGAAQTQQQQQQRRQQILQPPREQVGHLPKQQPHQGEAAAQAAQPQHQPSITPQQPGPLHAAQAGQARPPAVASPGGGAFQQQRPQQLPQGPPQKRPQQPAAATLLTADEAKRKHLAALAARIGQRK